MRETKHNQPVSGAPGTDILSGLRILDFSHQIAGPFATMILADAGAEVIKVESPGRGDGIRHDAKSDPEIGSYYFWGVNRNKRSITLNLKTEEGRAIALDLAAEADVVVENFRPGVIAKLGLSYEDIKAIKPDIIYLSVSAFGSGGPLRDRPGMDLILQATSGVMGITGESDDRAPVKLGPPVMDMTTALYGAIGILLALLDKARTGQGRNIDISMLDCGITLMAPLATALLNGPAVEGRYGSGHPNLTPYQAYRDSEGAYFIVACLTNKFWKKLCARLDQTGLTEDPRFVDMRSRNANRAELNAILEGIFAGKTADDWIGILSRDDIPCARINMPSEALALEQVAHNGLIRETEHPVVGTRKIVASPLKLERSDPRHTPMLGEHTDEVLAEIGRSPDEIRRLRKAGVL